MNFKFGRLEGTTLSNSNTTSGTAFIIYGDSSSRKSRTLGTLDHKVLHISLDGGTNSAQIAANQLDIKGEHDIVPVAAKQIGNITVSVLQQLEEAIRVLQTDKEVKAKYDTIVFDSLIEINEEIFRTVSNLPRYKKDMLHIEDVSKEDPDKNAAGLKMLPLYADVQKITKELLLNILSLKPIYNIIMLAGEINLTDTKLVDIPTKYPKVNGPSSVRPVIGLFDEVYKTKFDEGVFDTKDNIHTKFTLSKYNDPVTGIVIFSKTRNITDMEALQANEIVADFRVIFKNIGYINKADRK